MVHYNHPLTQQSFENLMKGNQRFLSNQLMYPNQTIEYRNQLVNGAKPFATILTCSDSRVPPELIFDCGFGDLFVIRNAGNVLDDHAIGSIEFGVDTFRIPLLVVMGHTGCAAVRAAIEGLHFPDHRNHIMHTLSAVALEYHNLQINHFDTALELNVRKTVQLLKQCKPTIQSVFEKGSLGILGAIYEIETGRVRFLAD
ncbi:MAG: carbonic anhydrase [bacterium]|nr:carbonic anhydrase [bacterium]